MDWDEHWARQDRVAAQAKHLQQGAILESLTKSRREVIASQKADEAKAVEIYGYIVVQEVKHLLGNKFLALGEAYSMSDSPFMDACQDYTEGKLVR